MVNDTGRVAIHIRIDNLDSTILPLTISPLVIVLDWRTKQITFQLSVSSP